MFDVNIFGTKITEIIFKGYAKYFRDGAFRMKLCLCMIIRRPKGCVIKAQLHIKISREPSCKNRMNHVKNQ